MAINMNRMGCQDAFDSQRTLKGFFMTAQDNKKPNDETTYQAAYHTAIRLLGRRAHSRKELAQKLGRRGYPDPIIDAVLRSCENHHYIDDAATCDSYCRELIRKGFGPRMIRQRIAKRGIKRDLIESVLETRYPRDAVRTTARAVAARKRDQLEGRFSEKRAIATRLARFLSQRGFPAGVIRDIVAEQGGDESI